MKRFLLAGLITILFSSPSYSGSISHDLKRLLDGDLSDSAKVEVEFTKTTHRAHPVRIIFGFGEDEEIAHALGHAGVRGWLDRNPGIFTEQLGRLNPQNLRLDNDTQQWLADYLTPSAQPRFAIPAWPFTIDTEILQAIADTAVRCFIIMHGWHLLTQNLLGQGSGGPNLLP